MKKKKKAASTAVLVFAVAGAASAGSVYSFDAISYIGSSAANVGENQFTVEIIDQGPGSVGFLFENSGPYASSLAALYWEDDTDVLGSLTGWSSTQPIGQVDFDGSGLPSALAGTTIDDESIAANVPPPHRGVNPGEDVTVSFALNTFVDYDDVLAALDSSALQIGIHAIDFDDEESVQFVNTYTPPGGGGNPVPSPTAALTGLVMFSGLVMRRRRRD